MNGGYILKEVTGQCYNSVPYITSMERSYGMNCSSQYEIMHTPTMMAPYLESLIELISAVVVAHSTIHD